MKITQTLKKDLVEIVLATGFAGIIAVSSWYVGWYVVNNVLKPAHVTRECVRTYSDTNKDGLYDLLTTEIKIDGQLKHSYKTKLGKLVTKEELERVHGIDGTKAGYETIKIE